MTVAERRRQELSAPEQRLARGIAAELRQRVVSAVVPDWVAEIIKHAAGSVTTARIIWGASGDDVHMSYEPTAAGDLIMRLMVNGQAVWTGTLGPAVP